MARVVSWRGCAKFCILPVIPCTFSLLDSLLRSRSGRVASARAAANGTRKMITVPRIYECLLQRTISSHLNYSCTSVQRPPWGQKKVAIVERIKQKWMYGLSGKKMAIVERSPLLEVQLYIESFLRATFIYVFLVRSSSETVTETQSKETSLILQWRRDMWGFIRLHGWTIYL